MRILGIHDGHNSSAALIEDSKLIYCIQEERLTNVKNQSGFPKLAVIEILKSENISINDIDVVVFAGISDSSFFNREIIMAAFANEFKNRRKRLSYYFPLNSKFADRIRAYKKSRNNKTSIINRKKLLKTLGYKGDVDFIDHHLSHCAAAYYGYGNMDDDVLIFTSDGAGDRLCATVNVGRNGKIKRLAKLPSQFSLARLYAMITFKLGMVPLEHEYKLMGLAPYGDEDKYVKPIEDVFSKLFAIENGDDFWNPSGKFYSIYRAWDLLEESLRFKRFDHICAAIQNYMENITTKWISNWVKKTGIHKIALGGGIFMNVKMNKAIYELPEIKSMFVFPSCGDESNSIGAAYYCAVERNGNIPEKLVSLYLGTESVTEDVDEAISLAKRRGYEVNSIENIEEVIAKLLANNEVVARHKGRFEFGARALGNRSILANPSWPDSVRTINDMIKKRDFWMPFAMSVLREYQDEVFDAPKETTMEYMINTFDVKEKYRHLLSGGIHPRDFTTRPQVVSFKANKDYYNVIKIFHGITGFPMILNTSLNLHGLPLVSTPMQSMYVLINSGLKYLAIENFMIKKKN